MQNNNYIIKNLLTKSLVVLFFISVLATWWSWQWFGYAFFKGLVVFVE